MSVGIVLMIVPVVRFVPLRPMDVVGVRLVGLIGLAVTQPQICYRLLQQCHLSSTLCVRAA